MPQRILMDWYNISVHLATSAGEALPLSLPRLFLGIRSFAPPSYQRLGSCPVPLPPLLYRAYTCVSGQRTGSIRPQLLGVTQDTCKHPSNHRRASCIVQTKGLFCLKGAAKAAHPLEMTRFPRQGCAAFGVGANFPVWGMKMWMRGQDVRWASGHSVHITAFLALLSRASSMPR